MKKKRFLIGIKIFVSFICLLGITFFVIGYVNKKKIALEKQNEFLNKVDDSVESQIGNYMNGGLYVNGYIYLLKDNTCLGCYDKMDDWKSYGFDTIYRVDSEGNYEVFFEFSEYESRLFIVQQALYYYDGYFYLKAYDGTGKLIRVTEDGKSSQVIYESDQPFLFGVRDNYLFMSDREETSYLDLDEGINFANKRIVKKEQHSTDLYNRFFYEWIYNCKDISAGGAGEEYDRECRQYYKGMLYNTVYTGLEWDSNRYDTRELVKWGTVNGNEQRETLVSNVLSFNIYEDKLYYTQYENGDNMLMRMDMDGGNVTELYSFHFDEPLYCKSIVVGGDIIICDFGPKEYVDGVDYRYVVSEGNGVIDTISFYE